MKKINLIILSCFISFIASAQIKHMEPPNWWVGMENQELQIMFHGENIGEYDVTLKNKNVKLEEIVKTDNPNYIFVYLSIPESCPAGKLKFKFKSDSDSFNQEYHLLERETGSSERMGFNSSDVIYLITPDRFANGDPSNDDVPELKERPNREHHTGRHGGDIKGIIDNLDYIKDMGYTAIWPNPLLINDMANTSYHGYAITDYYLTDPRLGTNEDYKLLVEEAKKRGLKVIMDQIMNHCGSQHWWMKDLPTKTWINKVDNVEYCNHRRTTLTDPYAAPKDYEGFVDGWFVEVMPDLNHNDKLLADYMAQNSIWWIEYLGLQGIRHDTHPYAGEKAVGDWTCRIMNEYPNFNIVGEEWSPNPMILAKWQTNSKLQHQHVSCLNSLMDFPLQISLVQSLKEGESWNKGFVNLYEMLSNDVLYADPQNMVVFVDNHDMSRFYSQIDEDLDLFKMGMSYIATIRGIPQIFYGTEILMNNPGTEEHGIIRSDFPGGWEGDEQNAFTQENLTEKQKETQDFVKALLNWRKSKEVIHTGKLMHFGPKHDGVYVYGRYNEEETVLIILNKSEENVPFTNDNYKDLTKGFTYGIDVISAKKYDLNNMELPGRSALILELR